jgi:hypothetical protein
MAALFVLERRVAMLAQQHVWLDGQLVAQAAPTALAGRASHR